MTIAETFDQQYRVDEVTGCWVWLRARKGKEAKRGGGYGCFTIRGKSIAAHRFAWERRFGAIPLGIHVSHKCHNTLCVNVEHMCLETNDENAARSARDLRRAQKLTVAAVQDIKRSCAAGALQREMAEKYGIAQGDVSHIINGHWWAHVTP